MVCLKKCWIISLQLSAVIYFLLYSTVSLADCDFVIVNKSQTSFEQISSNLRAEEIGGYAVAPLCSQLPKQLRNTTYKAYCDNPKFQIENTIFAPYEDVQSCQQLVGTHWDISYSDASGYHAIASYQIQKSNISDLGNTILIIYKTPLKSQPSTHDRN